MNFSRSIDSLNIQSPYEKNNGEVKVELGTYIPLREQLKQFKQAGINLLAWRQAQADIINATDPKTGEFLGFDDIENFEDYTRDMSIDEIDVHRLKILYRDTLKNKTFGVDKPNDDLNDDKVVEAKVDKSIVKSPTESD